jgi:hypothetical protein
LNEHFTGGKVNNYLVQEIFIGGVLFIMYYKFCLSYNVAFIIFSVSPNVDNKIEPETIETREKSEIKNNSEPDLHLNTHDLDTVPKEVSNIKLTVNEATKHTKSEHTVHHVHLTSHLFSLRIFKFHCLFL